VNTLHGSLGKTLLIAPSKDSIGAKELLIIGLGDSQTLSPQRMQLVGEILYAEASRLGVAHPFFAPTTLDGGVSNSQPAKSPGHRRFPAGRRDGQTSQGCQRIARSARHRNHLPPGAMNTGDTQEGIEKAVATAARRED
jgi:hypothetical protein